MNNNTELHQRILDELIFPYIMGECLPQFLPELAGGLLFLRFSRKLAVFELFCAGHSGADAQLGLSVTVSVTRVTLLTNTSSDADHQYFK
jgi:hypothetical protein